MTPTTAKLSRKKEQAITSLLQCPTIADAAKASGIGEATLFRWLKDTEFMMEFRNARMEIVRHAIAQLQNATGQAVQTLREVMTDEECTPSSRVTAAKTILEMSFRAVEIESLEERIVALEEANQ